MTDSHAERRAAFIAASLAAPLVLLTVLVIIGFQPLLDFDAAVVRSWDSQATAAGWRPSLQAIARVTGSAGTLPLLLVVAIYCAVRRHLLTALWVVVTALIATPLWVVGKQLIHRPRPHVVDQIDGWSFPSGHATGISVAMGVLVVLTLRWVGRPRLRYALTTLWVGIALLVGLDRVLLGAHNPSDVVAGWLLGSLVVFSTSAVFGIIDTTTGPPPERPLSSMPESRSSLAIILNPIKIDDAESFKIRVGRTVRAAGWDQPLWFETTVDDAGASMARAAVAAGADMVVAAGGDGTVRVVCSEMAGSGVPVGVIPAGTGNLLARNLGIPLVYDQALDTVLGGQDRAIDVVDVEGDGIAPTSFVVMAGLGLDAAIMDGAPDALKAKIGWPAYVVAAARQLRYPAIRVEISMDGGVPVRRRARTVVIGNVGSLQAGIPLLPDAEIDDGQLDVVVIAPRQFFGWLPLALRVLARRRRTDDSLDRFTGRSVSITTAHATPRQLDGDTVGAGTEMRARIRPGVLLVRVPR